MASHDRRGVGGVTRRSRPPKQEFRIPYNYVVHDGLGCPVDPDSKPATYRRNGQHGPHGGLRASAWSSFAAGCMWSWADRDEPEPDDIMAYLPDPNWETVEIPFTIARVAPPPKPR